MEKKIFAGTLLVSDIDGTLVPTNQVVPPQNLEAIARYCALGGKFAFATGRSFATAGRMLSWLTPNAPCIFVNGVQIFDTKTKEVLMQKRLPAEADALLKGYFDRYPDCAAVVMAPDGLYVARSNAISDDHDRITDTVAKRVAWEDLPAEKLKIIFMAPEATIGEMVEWEAAHPSELVETCRSWPEYFEVLPKNGNKGQALVALRDILNIPAERSFAIGDFDNDEEMVRVAGIGAAPQNATEKVRSLAKVIVCDCDDGAVADFIAYLERKLTEEQTGI
ncbi:MAG: HAD-IIB family hydrolase [Clostridia bacterium]|nr:HAD-IIB family hydrolase [Clostridia bacterium]